MRLSALLLALLPVAALADDIPLSSEVTAVTLYPQGATVTREVAFSMPAGSHSLILTDLPRSTPLGSVRVATEGAAMGSVSARRDFVPPRDPRTDAAIAAAEAEIERLEAALRDGEAGVETLRLAAQAARARIGFLEALGGAEGLSALDPETLRAMVAMIGDETLTALNAAHDATRRAADADRALKDQRAELKRARQALAALVPEAEARAMLAVAVSAEAPAQGRLIVTYTIDEAGWQPVYDLRLDRAGGRLEIERGALVSQATGENWRDVALRMSTSRPSQRTEPGEVWPWLRRIADPEQSMPKPLVRAEAEFSAGAAMDDRALRAAPVVAAPEFEGLSVSYAYPDPVSVASGADSLRIGLGGIAVSADPVAEAAPLSDSTAYLVARIVNATGEPILPTHEASFYLDGRFLARRALGAIPAGGKADLAFGPVEGLQLTRTVLDRNEGDRGVITRSNQITEEVRIEVENLTAEAWPLRLLDRVPYSEQEDLRVEWSATPRPAEENVDGKRGVLAWEFDLAPGETTSIALKHRLQWPDGKVLE